MTSLLARPGSRLGPKPRPGFYFQVTSVISQLQGSGRALAAVKGWTIYQTDIVQEFLYGKLEDVELYINPPARYPCHLAYLPKLLLAICDLHQGPVKFKQ